MKRFLDWLLYDKPLFNRVNTPSRDKSIRKEDWKKNWLGLTKVYDSYDKQYNWCFIKISSHLTDDDTIKDLRNTLSIGFGNYFKKWLLPFSIIKPILDYHHYVKDENGKDTDKIKWSVYVEREYEICIVKDSGYFSFNWNNGSNFLYNITNHEGYSFWLWFFWKQCNRTKKELLNIDGSLFQDLSYLKGKDSYEIEKQYEEMQPSIHFDILDYDKEPIEVKARLERSTYTYGNSKLTKLIMRLFKKPIIDTYLDLDFNKEVGDRKGSWKGGITGHSVNLLENEDPIDAFKRYCITPSLRGSRNSEFTNMTLLGYTIYQDVGLTDRMLIKAKHYNPYIFNVIDFQDRGIKDDNDFKKDYDLNLACYLDQYSVSDAIKNHNLPTDKLYRIKDEKILGTLLYQFYKRYYTGINKSTVTSNGVFIYYFTEKAYLYLKDKDIFKYVEFEEL